MRGVQSNKNAGECVYETVFCYLSNVCMKKKKKKKKIEFGGIFTNVPPSIAIKKGYYLLAIYSTTRRALSFLLFLSFFFLLLVNIFSFFRMELQLSLEYGENDQIMNVYNVR